MSKEKSEQISAAKIAGFGVIVAALISAIAVIIVAVINKSSNSNQNQTTTTTSGVAQIENRNTTNNSNNSNTSSHTNINSNSMPPLPSPKPDPKPDSPPKSDIQIGGSVAGTLAENAHKDYKFLGYENSSILFTIQRTDGGFWYRAKIFDSSGIQLKEYECSAFLIEKFTFTPPSDGLYKLQLSGERNFGTYVLKLSAL
jgi:hypothetical protein